MHPIEQLLYLQGIGHQYTGYNGDNITITDEIRQRVLTACGYELDNINSINDVNFQLDVAPWFNIINQTSFVNTADYLLKIRVNESQLNSKITLQVYHSSKLVSQKIADISDFQEFGNYHYNNECYRELAFNIEDLGIGYYQIKVTIDDSENSGQLIIYPDKAYQNIDNKIWGISLQLYSLRSDDNYGIGDFNDLKQTIMYSSKQGADYILVNPLHALFDDDPNRASPYSPSDRLCLNPLYIHIQDIPDFKECLQAQALVKSHLSISELQTHKNEVYINYKLVTSYKYQVFFLLFTHFNKHHRDNNTEYFKLFNDFKSNHGRNINSYCDWVCDLKNINENYKNREFIAYLQWQANRQLDECQQFAKQCSMKIGLIKDLAVGCAQDGNEFLENEHLFIKGASIGAPPDPWALEGQNWGLPPIEPIKLKQSGFNHYIKLLQSNMKHCGALRIDHIMAMLRLWWCILDSNKQNKGCYVYYPFEELLALLKLESHLNQCVVIGEDLGVVPTEIKSALHASDIYSNLLFYFEKSHLGKFISPHDFKKHAMIMVANHDVPTFKAWWQTSDINLRNELALFVDEDARLNETTQRHCDKSHLIDWLNQYHYQKDISEFSLDTPHQIIYQNLLMSLANSDVKLVTIQLDDLDDNELPANIPGTDKAYSNWRRRLSHLPSELFSNNDFFKHLNQARNSNE
jgi:4-alpha-glucanotransferase